MKKLFLIFSLSFLMTTLTSVAQETERSVKTSVIHDVDVSQFNKLVSSNKGIVLDVRTPEEWAEGTISTPTKINYYDDNFAEQVEKLDKNTPIFVYCKKGGRSAGAAEVLKEKGFTSVFNLKGGITAWKKEGLEIKK